MKLVEAREPKLRIVSSPSDRPELVSADYEPPHCYHPQDSSAFFDVCESSLKPRSFPFAINFQVLANIFSDT